MHSDISLLQNARDLVEAPPFASFILCKDGAVAGLKCRLEGVKGFIVDLEVIIQAFLIVIASVFNGFRRKFFYHCMGKFRLFRLIASAINIGKVEPRHQMLVLLEEKLTSRRFLITITRSRPNFLQFRINKIPLHHHINLHFLHLFFISIKDRIAHQNTLQINLPFFIFLIMRINSQRQIRDKLPCIGLPSNIEVVVMIFGEFFLEQMQQGIQSVRGSVNIIKHILFVIIDTVAYSGRQIDEDQVGSEVPAVDVVGEDVACVVGVVGGEEVRSQFHQKAQLRTTRETIYPESYWLVIITPFHALYEDVMQLPMFAFSWQVPSEHTWGVEIVIISRHTPNHIITRCTHAPYQHQHQKPHSKLFIIISACYKSYHKIILICFRPKFFLRSNLSYLTRKKIRLLLKQIRLSEKLLNYINLHVFYFLLFFFMFSICYYNESSQKYMFELPVYWKKRGKKISFSSETAFIIKKWGINKENHFKLAKIFKN